MQMVDCNGQVYNFESVGNDYVSLPYNPEKDPKNHLEKDCKKDPVEDPEKGIDKHSSSPEYDNCIMIENYMTSDRSHDQ